MLYFLKKILKNTWRYHYFTPAYQKPQPYEARFLRYGVRQTNFFVILGHISHFYPSNNPENKNFEKIKKAFGNVIILHLRTKNQDHMMNVSWDMECERQNFLSFWSIFCTFTPLLTPEIKILKKCKNTWRYYLFTCVHHKWRSNDAC